MSTFSISYVCGFEKKRLTEASNPAFKIKNRIKKNKPNFMLNIDIFDSPVRPYFLTNGLDRFFSHFFVTFVVQKFYILSIVRCPCGTFKRQLYLCVVAS